jgi:hypothetical protein
MALCRSKRSIKRDVKKKSFALTGGEISFSRSSPLKFHFSGEVWLVIHSVSSSADGDAAVEFKRAASERVASRQPWFYPRLVAYDYFWLSERA